MLKPVALAVTLLLTGWHSALAATSPDHQRPKGMAGVAANPGEAWAVVYLLNTAMLAELEAVNLAVEGAAREALLKSPEGLALLQRVHFAVAQAKEKSQMVPDGFAAKTGLPPGEKGKTALGQSAPAALAASFNDEAMRKSWLDFASLYATPMPTCPLTSDDVKSYADHQARIVAGSGGNTGVSIKTLLAPIENWSQDKRRCLALVLMGMLPQVKKEPGYEPLHLLAALRDSGMAQDFALRVLLATRYLQLGQYPESLRTLVELSDAEPAFRLPYELVQRVFGLRQRGPGAVALQGI